MAGATVQAALQEPGTMEALQTSEVTAVTNESGAYMVRFLAPGTYLLSVEAAAGTASSQTVIVGDAEDVGDVAFIVTP